ncbi:MAG TPA: hypothetical protein VEL79_07545 [Vicinamibacterales bacterium]|nr:hypothetical protein [Vicinamibacterales bacterium]
MRRVALAALAAALTAAIIAACGGSTPVAPTSSGSGTGGSGGGTPNTPPTIKSIAVSDTRIEVGTPVTLTATVEDAETPVDNLTYQWTAATGTFSGTGRVVTWTAGADAVTPADFPLRLTVTEHTAGSTAVVNTVTASVTVHVNNSPKELADLSLRFLGDFADSRISPDTCVSEFSNTCKSGKADEFSNISDNRHDFQILSSTLRTSSVDWVPVRANATVHTFCHFESLILHTPANCSSADCPVGTVQKVEGDCYTTDIYENGRWWLCESHFNGVRVLSALERAFFGIRRPEIP